MPVQGVASSLPEPAAPPRDARVLSIAARAQAPESPPSGWCGETAIQEGLLYLGVWATQKKINALGRPAHPDLYSNEIPAALSALGVKYTMYSGATGYAPFARWVRAAVDEGVPVLAGVKILPTQHPEWGLDHFVLAVGYSPSNVSLLVNTTWGRSEWVADTEAPGLSLKNAVYGIRLERLALPSNVHHARATFVSERETGAAHLSISCPGLSSVRATIERCAALKAKSSECSSVGDVDDTPSTQDVTLADESLVYFRCRVRKD
jgi:hypothetical protein